MITLQKQLETERNKFMTPAILFMSTILKTFFLKRLRLSCHKSSRNG